MKHRLFLKSLEDKKNKEREEAYAKFEQEQMMLEEFKTQAKKQRDKIRQMQDAEN